MHYFADNKVHSLLRDFGIGEGSSRLGLREFYILTGFRALFFKNARSTSFLVVPDEVMRETHFIISKSVCMFLFFGKQLFFSVIRILLIQYTIFGINYVPLNQERSLRVMAYISHQGQRSIKGTAKSGDWNRSRNYT